MATARGSRNQRRSDIRLIVLSALMVIAAGGLIAVGLLAAMGSSDSPTCGRLPLGSAENIRNELAGSPQFRTGGGDCGFYLALEGGDIVAYKLRIDGRDCTVRFRDDRFWCGDEPVASDELEEFPTSIETVDDVDTLVVDLRSEEERDSTPTSN